MSNILLPIAETITRPIHAEAYASGYWSYAEGEPCPYPKRGRDSWAEGARRAWIQGYKDAQNESTQ